MDGELEYTPWAGANVRSSRVEAGLRVGGSARAAVMRRCSAACERCGLEWPWLLYLFLVDDTRPATASNLRAVCARCSASEPGTCAPLVVERSLRERMRDANNRRTGALKLTSGRRKHLIEARGGRCERCGVSGSERRLEVHHVLAVLRGGDDDPSNLLVLCFACHHHVQPCAAGCGRWAKKPAALCPRCETRRLLELAYPGLSWVQIKALHRLATD